jgi:GTP-binding protein HflX
MRGPGETQLETDRRMIGQKIAKLKENLERVSRQRATRRKGREDQFRASLVGYTNAGKSSLLRALSDADVLVEDRLFATLDATTRSIELEDGYECLLTDTVGFIRKLPHHLVASFRATLEEAVDADLLLHVIDVSHPGWEEQKRVVDEVLEDLDLTGHPTLLVFNKVDRLTHNEEEAIRARLASDYNEPSIFVSSVERGGIEPVRELLLARVRSRSPEFSITVPAGGGRLLAEIYREGEVLSRDDVDGKVVLRARLPVATLGKLRGNPEVELSEAR